MWTSRGSKLCGERNIIPGFLLSLIFCDHELDWRVPQVRDPGTRRLLKHNPCELFAWLRRREYKLPVKGRKKS